MTPTIPESVKIGAYTVKVVYERHIMTDDDQCGNFSAREMIIRIDPDCGDELKLGVFYHELVEAIKSIYHIDCLKEDHHAICLMGEALFQLLRDNGEKVLPK